jgi:hypothetical protein
MLAGLAGMVGKHHRRALAYLAQNERQEGYPLMGVNDVGGKIGQRAAQPFDIEQAHLKAAVLPDLVRNAARAARGPQHVACARQGHGWQNRKARPGAHAEHSRLKPEAFGEGIERDLVPLVENAR